VQLLWGRGVLLSVAGTDAGSAGLEAMADWGIDLVTQITIIWKEELRLSNRDRDNQWPKICSEHFLIAGNSALLLHPL